MTHKWGRMATYPKLGDIQFSSREERPHGETPHSMRVSMPSLNCPYPWSSGARNLWPNIRGGMGFVAILGKTAKIHPKVVTRKIVSPYHKRYEPRAFAWMQTEALLPFCNKTGVQSIMEGLLTPQSLKHTIYGEKCIYRQYLYVHIFGSLRSKNMSKHFWSRPILGAIKYAHYG